MKTKVSLTVLLISIVLSACLFKVAPPPGKTLRPISDDLAVCKAWANRFKRLYQEDAIEYTEAEALWGKAKSAYDTLTGALESSVNNDTQLPEESSSEMCSVAAERANRFVEYVKAKTTLPERKTELPPRMPTFGGEGEEKRTQTGKEIANEIGKVLSRYWKAKEEEKKRRKEEIVKELEKLRWPDFRHID